MIERNVQNLFFNLNIVKLDEFDKCSFINLNFLKVHLCEPIWPVLKISEF